MRVKVKVSQLMSNSFWPHGLYSPWNSPEQNTGVDSLSLLQGIFPTQGLNQGLPHCRWILYQLSHKGSPRILEWVAYAFSRGSSQPRNQTGSPELQADPLPSVLFKDKKNIRDVYKHSLKWKLSNTLATWCSELIHWKRPWCCERLRAGGEGGERGWDDWMASSTQWTWVWANSRR